MKTTKKNLLKVATMALVFGATLTSCTKDVINDPFSTNDIPELGTLDEARLEVIAYTPKNAIIAHRGTEFWAPEESEAAMRWARNQGADYLEIDVQMTKDGVVLALHDESLSRTTDIESVYPTREVDYTSSFTYDELLKLDIGSWFNAAVPERARESFVGLDMLCVEDVLAIAEGKRIKRDENGKRVVERDAEGNYLRTVYEPDPADNGNRPGVYIETKSPIMFRGVEKQLRKVLEENGWYAEDIKDLKEIETFPGKVGFANTPARVILQTFDSAGLASMKAAFAPRVMPTLYLMMDMVNSTPASYAMMINTGIKNGATHMGPNIDYVDGYPTSLNVWQTEMIRSTGMDIHAWSFNTNAQYLAYTGPYRDIAGEGGAEYNACDMTFTNRTDLTIKYYKETLAPYAAAGRNYFRSNESCREWGKKNGNEVLANLPDDIHASKEILDPRKVLDDLGY